MFSLLMSVQVNPLLSLRQCFNMSFALFSSYLWKFLKIMYRPCKSQQDNGKHNTGSITTEESVAELACLQSRLSTSWKHLGYHDVKNTTKKTQGCWAARIWYWTRMRHKILHPKVQQSSQLPDIYGICLKGEYVLFFW